MNRIILISVFTILTINVMAQEKVVQTAGRNQLGEFAPKFAELNEGLEIFPENRRLDLAFPSNPGVTFAPRTEMTA